MINKIVLFLLIEKQLYCKKLAGGILTILEILLQVDQILIQHKYSENKNFIFQAITITVVFKKTKLCKKNLT